MWRYETVVTQGLSAKAAGPKQQMVFFEPPNYPPPPPEPARDKRLDSYLSLAAAVLEDAFGCRDQATQSQNSGQRRRRQRQVEHDEEWLRSDDVIHPFSFANICQLLGLDPSKVREAYLIGRELNGHRQSITRRRVG